MIYYEIIIFRKMKLIQLIKKKIKSNLTALIISFSILLISISLPGLLQETQNNNFIYEE